MWTLNDCKPELWSYKDMWLDVGCWRTITACVTTKLTVICSHHGTGRMENINNKKKKAKPKKGLVMPKMEISVQ